MNIVCRKPRGQGKWFFYCPPGFFKKEEKFYANSIYDRIDYVHTIQSVEDIICKSFDIPIH